MDRDALIEVALRHLAEGTLEPDVLVPVLRDLIGEQEGTPVSLGDLVSALGERGGGSFDALRERVKQLRVDLAGRVNQARRAGQEIPPECRRNLSDLPLDASLDWRTQADCGERFELALGMLRDHFYAANKQVDAPAAASLVGEAFRRSVEDLERTPRPWSILGLSQLVRNTLDDDPDAALRERLDELQALIERQQAADRQAVEDALDRWPEFPLPEALDEAAVIEGLRQRFWSAPDPTAKRGWLDLILSWPTDRVVSLVLEIAQVPWIQDRVTLMTKLRFGGQRINSWSARRQWLQEKKQAEDRLARRLRENSPELLLFWAMCSPEPVVELIAALDAHCRDRSPAVDPEAFFDRWREQLDPQEASLMLDLPVLAAAPVEPAAAVVESQQTPGDEQAAAPPPVPLPPMESAPVPKLSPVPHRPRVPRQPRPTPLWKEHLRGFLAENGYLFAGILMVLVGSSLTALFTWDWGWVWRYTLMPALLGTFTFALAWVGDSLEKRDERLLGTGAILRGAAICLLPANFMAVALLAGDPEVPNQQLMLLMMGGIYVVLFGWGLNRWCRQVEPRIGIVIPAALMLLNGLVLLRPTALLLGKVQPDALNLTLGSGFHLGFVIGAASLIWFIRRVLTAEMAFERRVPLFVGAVLGVTFLEVLGWVHGSMRELPRVYTYSTMMVLSGGVVLLCEQRVLALRRREAEHLEASFLGFALILLGIMMGFSQPYMRIACLTLGGVIWVGQALPRRNPLHHAIGLSMFCLGVASVGLLPVYPRAWLPALGLGLSVALAFIADRDRPALKEAAHGLLSVVLTLTSITAVLAQWHYQTPPLATACQLLILAVLMFWRGQRDEMPMWVHGGMLMLALALPYLGCVDLSEHPARGNTMSFGLSVIAIGWLLTIRLSGSELLRHARSTVLLFYGGLALAALVLRVGFESAQPPDADDLWLLFDYAGPLMMSAVLMIATYHSRSLVPALMSMVILVVLFPELRVQFKETFDRLQFGSGLGGACTALGLALLCFPVRRWKLLEGLPEGDLYMGRTPFPLRRYDHTLFTWPLVATVLFLIARTDSWTLLKNLAEPPEMKVGLATAGAIALTGVSWTLMAVFHRTHRAAVAGTHLGWLSLLAGISLAYFERIPDPSWAVPCLVLLGVLTLLYGSYQFFLVPRAEWVRELLAEPTHQVLDWGSALVACLVALDLFLGGTLASPLRELLILLAALLAWHGLGSREPAHGVALCILAATCVLAQGLSGSGPLLGRFELDPGLRLIIWTTLVIMVLQSALEPIHKRAVGLYRPFLGFVSVAGLVCGLGVGYGVCHGLRLGVVEQAVLIFVLLRNGRDNRSGVPLLVGCLLTYLLAHHSMLVRETQIPARLMLLAEPWRLGLFSLLLGLAGLGHTLFWERKEGVRFGGPAPIPGLSSPIVPWLLGPAGLLACAAAIGQNTSLWRDQPIQLLAPYLGVLTLGILGLVWRQPTCLAAACVLLSLGNIHSVRLSVGDLLLSQGLSQLHLVCLGLGVSLIMTALLGRIEVLREVCRQAGIAGAGLVIALLWTNYFVHPDLGEIPTLRFLISGAMFLVAGFYFRHAARTSESNGAMLEGLYHMGLAMAIACFALIVPGLRRPETALAALGLPAIYFYLRAELSEEGSRYRDSAATLSFVILGMYVCFGVAQLIFFPDKPLMHTPYHTNAPLIMLVAGLMLRLHGLGGTEWLALYGGLGLMAGSYFALTALPGLSPFEHPVASAWCAIALGHFWTVASAERSPLRTWVQQLAGLDGNQWFGLRRNWGVCLLVATQVGMLRGLADYQQHPEMVALLLVGGASMLLHHGLRRGSPVYFALAGLQLLLALHADFVVSSYLSRDLVIWTILGFWVALLVAHRVLPRRIELPMMGRSSLALLALASLHVIYHHPGSAVGLWATVCIMLISAAVPRKGRTAANLDELFWAGLLVAVPTWLTFWSQLPYRETDLLDAVGDPRCCMSVTLALLLTGGGALLYQRFCHAAYEKLERYPPRLLDQTLNWLGQSGGEIFSGLLWPVFGFACIEQLLLPSQSSLPEFTMICLLQAGLAVSWLEEGMRRKTVLPYIVAQVSLFALLLAIRGRLEQVAGWTSVHDVYALLGLSLALTGLMQVIEQRSREIRESLKVTYFALPALSIYLTQAAALSSDITLMVVGLHSVMFSYLGRNDRESPYRVAGLVGGVAFVLIAFWSKLELRVLHAYVIPVGVGVLILLHLFERHIEPESRNTIRLFTLLAMLGSSAYYVLVDDRYPVVYNATLLCLCLSAMGLGSFLRVRLYMMLGFTGVVVNLAIIVVKALLRVDHAARMTSLGVLVLIGGIALVSGAVYYKTHREELNEKLDAWRGTFSAWE